MSEVNLTDEQVEKAAEAARSRFNGFGHKPCGSWQETVVAAAPLLQFPIAPPTEEEINRIHAYMAATPGPYRHGLASALRAFIDSRNAPPAPVDPRRESIRKVILSTIPVPTDYVDKFTDKILAALDEVSK